MELSVLFHGRAICNMYEVGRNTISSLKLKRLSTSAATGIDDELHKWSQPGVAKVGENQEFEKQLQDTVTIL